MMFDLNRTLVRYRTGKTADAPYIKYFNISRHKLWMASMPYRKDYALGRMHLKDFLLNTMKNAEIDKKFFPILEKLHEESFYPVKGMHEILAKLKRKYRIIMLAGDGFESVDFKIDDFGYRKYFDKIYSTCEEGMHKQDIRLYELVLKKEKARAEDIVFIDDDVMHISTANKCGMQGIVFKNSAQLISELKKRHLI